MKRTGNRLGSALALAIALLLSSPPATAQTAGAALKGRILDDQNRPVASATITATNTQTGLIRTQTSASDGSFRFPSLPVGTWNVMVEHVGFQTVVEKDLVLNVATTRDIAVSMRTAAVTEFMTVTSPPALIQSDPSAGAVVSKTELENLPLNGRQFANLGALAPGTQLAFNSDPTKPDQLTVALNGGIGRNVNYIVDGGDNTDDTIGGALQNYSVEGVEEFKIQTQQYKAEYGRSTGGVMSVVTKTGTNEFHGSVFGFFRNESLNSTTESETLAGADKASYDRKQYGFSVGGPLVKDKAHYFVTAERTDRNTNYIVATGIFPEFDGTAVPLPFKDTLVTAKVTVNIDPRQFVQIRYGYQKNTGKYGAGPLYTPDALGTLQNEFNSLLVGHTWTLPGGSLNDFLVQYSKFTNSITADSTNPSLYFPSGVSSGQNFNTPQTTEQVKWQFKDDFSWGRTFGGGRHDFKAGINYIHEPTLGGDFSTGVDAPRFTFSADDINAPITAIEQNGGKFVNSTPVDEYSVYFQDDWSVNPRLTLNLGLRYDYWDGFDLDQRSNPIWQFLSTQTTYNEGYLQDFQGGKGGVLQNDKNNFGPRVGFSWDLSGSGRTFLRGGFGIYYDFPYTNATILFPAGAVQSNYGVVYQNTDPDGIKNGDGSFFHVGDPLPPNQLPGLSVGAPREVASPTLATPYSRQASIGFSHQFNDKIGINIEATNIDYRDIPFRFRFNVIDPNTGDPRFPFADSIRLW
jgi:outer membrane receptor protein involved in Fe transport